MKHQYVYANGRIILKPLELEDIEELRELRNRERHCFLSTQIIEKDGQRKWYEAYLEKEGDIMFKVVKTTAPDEFIGTIAVYDIDVENKAAEFGRLVIDKEKAPEKGTGLDAVIAVCKFAFEKLKLNRISAVVLKDNERALKVYLKAGFRICGESDQAYNVEIRKEKIE